MLQKEYDSQSDTLQELKNQKDMIESQQSEIKCELEDVIKVVQL